jgi:hypothetical protein
MSVLFLIGIGGIVLGVLALLAIHSTVLTAVAAIAFGVALLFSSWAVWRLLTSQAVATHFQSRSPLVRAAASEVASASAGLQTMAGMAVIVLGIMAVCGIYTVPLTLVALLVAGASVLLTGSTLGGTMVGFMRSSPTAAPAHTS